MKIFYKSIIQIVPDNQFKIKELKGDVDENIRELLDYIVSKREKREYEMIEGQGISSQVIAFAEALTASIEMEDIPDLDALAGQMAGKYLEATSKMGNRVKTGNLLIALLRDDSKKLQFIAAQIDNEGFFESETFEKMSGFPDDNKKIWKTAVFRFAESPKICVQQVFVDTKGQAKYWADTFLGLKVKRLSKENTDRAIKAVDRVLRENVGQVSEQDYTVLRFTFLHKMLRDGTDINYTELIEELFENYVPRNQKFSAECVRHVKEELCKLPDKADFDTLFMTDASAVKPDTTVQKFEIDNGIELKLDWDVNPHDVISSDIDRTDGSKYIKIRCSDVVYKRFHKS